MAQRPDLDATDKAILALLQRDASLPLAEIAAAVGLTTSPCWKRIRRLEDTGVIRGRIAVVDAARVGLPLTAFVSVETADHSAAWMERFAAAIEALPEVLEVWRMAGDVDYVLRVVVPDMAAYDAFYRRLVAAAPLKNVTSRFAMEQVKGGTPLPVP
jgi:Lrp/AsnC family transcriptional regulator